MDKLKFDYGLKFTLESLNKYLNQNGVPTHVWHLQISDWLTKWEEGRLHFYPRAQIPEIKTQQTVIAVKLKISSDNLLRLLAKRDGV